MIRPTWTATTDEQNDLLAAAVREADERHRIAAALTEQDGAMWRAIKAARDAGVPDVLLCEQTGQSRATLNRRFGPRADGE